MERYKEYKDSGVQWIGEIPSHWNLRRIKYIFSELKEKSEEGLEIPLSLSKESGIIPFDEKKNKTMESASYVGGKIVHKGEIVFNRFKARLFAVSGYDGIVSSDYAVYKCSKIASSEYMVKLFGTDMYREAFNRKASGIGDGFSRLYSDDLFAMYSIFPPLPEQEKIVNYIESKISNIDEYIAEKEKEVQLLNELKEAEIAKVVTQGLNPNVKMKDSGIFWIGMIPEHWEVKRIASLFTGKVNTNSDFAYKHAFKFYYGTLVPKDEVGDAEEYRETYVKYQVIQKDDILVNGLNLNYDFVSQRVAIAPTDGIITSAYIVARPRKGTNADYYNYLFKAMDSKKLFHGMGTGIRLTLSFDELKKQIVVCPPIGEQQAIVAYINDKTAKVESLIANLQAEIEHLKEYKQRLIADCVTGQVNVQNE